MKTTKTRAQGESSRMSRETQGQRVGRVVAFLDGPIVDYPGNPHGPLQARSIVALDRPTVTALIEQKREVLLSFEADRSDRPIIAGLLVSPGTLPDAPAVALQAVVDGKRVVIKGEDEIVFVCGKASVTLRRNGRVIVRGTYVETASSGVNRVKGASVRVN